MQCDGQNTILDKGDIGRADISWVALSRILNGGQIRTIPRGGVHRYEESEFRIPSIGQIGAPNWLCR